MASKRNKKSKSIPAPSNDKPEAVETSAAEKSTKIFAPDDPTKQWTDEEGARHISHYDVLQLENLRSKIEALTFQSSALGFEANEKERHFGAVILQMRGQAKAHDRQRGEIEEEYSALIARLGEKYEVDFAKIGYDDQNGKLTPYEPEA